MNRNITFVIVGLLLLGTGVLYAKRGTLQSSEVQVISESSQEHNDSQIVVEVSGAVHSPGVYEFNLDARVDDALASAGGITPEADVEWVERSINKAAKLTDGQKIYIPQTGENPQIAGASVDSGGAVNINSASQSELESLWGIGPVYAQNIIEHRPYSSVEELLEKGIIKQNVYDRNSDKLTVY